MFRIPPQGLWSYSMQLCFIKVFLSVCIIHMLFKIDLYNVFIDFILAVFGSIL